MRKKFKLKEWHYALIGGVIGGLLGWWNPANVNPHQDGRDYNYENYVDSIYNNNPNYYLDVICETDEYQNYIEKFPNANI